MSEPSVPYSSAQPSPAGKPTPTAPQSKLKRALKAFWWLHSVWGLVFGVGIMIYARKGLAHADKLLVVAGISWILMFLALRFVVGAKNRKPDEHLVRKGVRVLTNYFVKNLYQQMFYFLVPLYASSATWAFGSWNWWLAPLLLICALVSTMDLFFDNVIMERRAIAATMYGLALFGVLNLMLPVAANIGHFPALVIAAGATAPAVALLNFPIRAVVSGRGAGLTLLAMAGLVAAAWFGRAHVPPAPLTLTAIAVGHGTPSTWECLPGRKTTMRSDRLLGLRCGSDVIEPGGLKDKLVHVWKRGERTVAEVVPMAPTDSDGRALDCAGQVLVSQLSADKLPTDPAGTWRCEIQTEDGQLIGMAKFRIVAPEKLDDSRDGTGDANVPKTPTQPRPQANPADAATDSAPVPTTPADAHPTSDAGLRNDAAPPDSTVSDADTRQPDAQ